MRKRLTVTELRQIIGESGFDHALFCLEQECSQYGREACADLWKAYSEAKNLEEGIYEAHGFVK